MSSSPRKNLLPVILLVAASLAGAGIAMLSLLPGGNAGAPQVSAVGGSFKLTAQDGRIVTDADLKGKPFIVFFGYTHCPDVCPTTAFDMSEVLNAMGPDANVAALFVTVDPDRDNPKSLGDYLSSFDKRLLGLSGDRAEVEKMLREYHVYARKVPGADGDYTMDHTSLVYLMDKNGNFVSGFNLERKPEESAKELASYL